MSKRTDKLVARATAKYPFMSKNDFAVTESRRKGYGTLETYPPGETGSAAMLRPADLPLDRYGIEVMSPDVTANDVAGDVYSHVDVAGKRMGRKLATTLTPRQVRELAQQYGDYRNTLRENSPNAKQRALTNGSDGILRTAALGQGGENAVRDLRHFRFSPEQKNIVANAKHYAVTGNDNKDKMLSLRRALGK